MGEIAVVDIDFLARRILELKEECKQKVMESLLDFKWKVGKEILSQRVDCNSLTFDELSKMTGISHTDLVYCVQFYQKYPDKGYELKAWRRIVAELPERNEGHGTDYTSTIQCDKFDLMCGDFREKSNEIESGSVDIIITDPPYGKEYILLYKSLAEVAMRVLKEGGSLVVMTGQSYLPEILQAISTYFTYNWVMTYLTPGGQSAQLWERKVNTFWKPVLWFVKGKYEGDWIGDVAKSDPNDNDKRYSKYGQSESGMLDIMKRFVKVNQVVLDPFMGAGTTGVAALKLGCRFIGIDQDAEMVKIAEDRLWGVD